MTADKFNVTPIAAEAATRVDWDDHDDVTNGSLEAFAKEVIVLYLAELSRQVSEPV